MKIGIQELLLVFIVALIVLGPDKLPLYARKFGEALREFRKFSQEATKDIRESIVEPLEEAQKPLKEALEPITELEKEVRGDVEGIQKSFSDIGKPAKEEVSHDGGETATEPKPEDADAEDKPVGTLEADLPEGDDEPLKAPDGNGLERQDQDVSVAADGTVIPDEAGSPEPDAFHGNEDQEESRTAVNLSMDEQAVSY